MTKQEEITRRISNMCGEALCHYEKEKYLSLDEFASKILAYLHSQGVVLKVDRELPNTPSGDPYDDYCNGYVQSQEDMVDAGYIAVKPLIEEE